MLQATSYEILNVLHRPRKNCRLFNQSKPKEMRTTVNMLFVAWYKLSLVKAWKHASFPAPPNVHLLYFAIDLNIENVALSRHF